MSDDEPLRPVYVFFLSMFGFGLVAIPLVATIDSVAFAGRLGGTVVPIASLALAIAPALEFAFSGRNPFLVGWYVGTFAVLYFLAIVGQAAVYVSLGIPEPIPAAELLVLSLTYVLSYVLVYRGGLNRLKRAITA